MRGDIVLVRAYGGEALRRVVWEVRGDKAMVLRPDYFERALRQEEVRSIGFPLHDVFEFDLGLYERLQAASRAETMALWAKARKYRMSN